MYPDDSLQSIIADPSKWWVKNEAGRMCRGALIYAFIPHIDQVPYSFEPVGRAKPDEHTEARVKVCPLKVNQPLKKTDLPVAAMPLYGNEVFAAYRAKRRPCLVIGSADTPKAEKALTRGMPNHATAQTILVAPHYGADKDGTRAGYNPEFVERIRHCEYPQFVWNPLPLDRGPNESIMRLDQIQPIGAHHDSHKLTDFKLGDEALEVMDELVTWIMWGGVPKGGHVATYRELIEDTFGT